jgi:hypothetical protein
VAGLSLNLSAQTPGPATTASTAAPTAEGPAASPPSVEVATFVGDNLARLLQPLYTDNGAPKGGNATAGKGKAGGKGKGGKKAGKKKNTGVGATAADESVKEFAGIEVSGVPATTRSDLVSLNAQLGKQAATAPAVQQAVYRQALGLTKVFDQIIAARDEQAAAVETVLKTRATNDLADTGAVETGKVARQNAIASETKAAADKNDDLDNLESKWVKTAAAYQQQVDYQLAQLRAAEQKLFAAPPSASPAG